MLEITHGTVTANNDGAVTAPVDKLIFPTFVQSQATPIPLTGVTGTLTIKSVPDHRNFANNERVMYANSNRNNDNLLKIIKVIGPTKFNVTVV